MKKNITDITELETKALIWIYDRAISIKKLIKHCQYFYEREDFVLLLNQFGLMLAIETYNRMAYVYYRSIFQNAVWKIGEKSKGIEPSVFISNFTTWQPMHDKICIYVNQVIAHQDANTSLRDVFSITDPATSDVLTVAPLFEPMHILNEDFRAIIEEILNKIEAEYKKRHSRELKLFVSQL
jgi:hypothetical protein